MHDMDNLQQQITSQLICNLDDIHQNLAYALARQKSGYFKA